MIYFDVEMSSCTPRISGGFPISAHPEPCTRIYSRGNGEAHSTILVDSSLTVAFLTWICYYFALTVASRAVRDDLLGKWSDSLHSPQASMTLAGGAFSNAARARCACTRAILARRHYFDLYLCFRAGESVLKRYLMTVKEI